jgi:hypothetical protein
MFSFPCCSTIADDSDQMEEHASVKQLKMNTEQGGAVTLEECFEVIVLNQTLMYNSILILILFFSG